MQPLVQRFTCTSHWFQAGANNLLCVVDAGGWLRCGKVRKVGGGVGDEGGEDGGVVQ